MFNTEVFKSQKKNRNTCTFDESNVVFVADLFEDEHLGGAELSTEALFSTAPYSTFKLKSSEVSEENISNGAGKIWVFFNFRGMNHQLIPLIVQSLNYYIVEYDYKFCTYRSMDLHKRETGNDCDCHDSSLGKLISSFYFGSNHIFWMSKQQKKIYDDRFPFLAEKDNTVLSSIFKDDDLSLIENLRNSRSLDGINDKYAIVDGKSWIKGVETTRAYLDNLNEEYDVLGGLTYSDLLRTLSEYKGLAFMPVGGDTCPRLVIEAKLLGLDLILNENVQHANEKWFNQDLDQIEMHLLSCHERFWSKITDFMEKEITLSGYTQAYNVMKSSYPWRESITSLLNFCDEVIVVDGGSDDGTWEELQTLSKLQGDGRLKVYQVKRDWNSKRFSLFDGKQKAVARVMCTKEWCWQQDIDEIVHEDDYDKIKKLAKQIPKSISLISLPVIEYWGGPEKIRMDINPSKWRLSRNDPAITHGIPLQHRKLDKEGMLYSAGSDGCDYIMADGFESIPQTDFFTPEARQTQSAALEGNKDAQKAYAYFMGLAYEQLPCVHHYSWFDIERKIHTYKNYWSRHWAALFDENSQLPEDTAHNNKFFDKPWSEVTDEEISSLASRLKEEMGGWVFHNRIDFEKPTPWIRSTKNQKHPSIMYKWVKEHTK